MNPRSKISAGAVLALGVIAIALMSADPAAAHKKKHGGHGNKPPENPSPTGPVPNPPMPPGPVVEPKPPAPPERVTFAITAHHVRLRSSATIAVSPSPGGSRTRLKK